jgi:adenosine/AMP kinase
MAVELEFVQIENPDELNLIFGQSHFIKTVEDVYEALKHTIKLNILKSSDRG